MPPNRYLSELLLKTNTCSTRKFTKLITFSDLSELMLRDVFLDFIR